MSEVRSPLTAAEIGKRREFNNEFVLGRKSKDTILKGPEKPRPRVVVDLEDDPHKVLRAIEEAKN